MKNKPLIVGALILATVAIASYVVYEGLQYKPGSKTASQVADEISKKEPPAPKKEPTTVTYDATGFSPKKITIAKGTTVHFISKTDQRMWVASDPHPEHTNYPEFDTENLYGDHVPDGNKTYEFRFDKVGTWTYHNHSAPEHQAIVQVR